MGLNDAVADRILARAIRLNRFSASERLKILSLHKELENELTKLVFKVDPSGGVSPSYQLARQNKLLGLSQETITAGMRDMRDTSKEGLIQLARDEAEWFVKTATSEIGVNLVTKELSTQQLKAIVGDRLINGAPSKEWWGRQAGDLQNKFADRIRLGMLRGNTTDEIVRAIRGTKAAGFTDGIMEGSRRQTEALVRTSVQAVANEARGKLYEENQDIIDGVTWLCFIGETLVKTPIGWKQIKSIQSGELVIGGSGMPRRVLATHQSVKRQMVRIKLSNGTVLTCTKDHLFLTAEGWKPAELLSQGESLESKLQGEPAFAAFARPSL